MKSFKEHIQESNVFTDARMNAIKAGKKSFKVGNKNYKVTGDTSDELNAGVSENSVFEVNDYFKRRQRYRDVDAGKPVKPEPKNPQNDYFARRKKEKEQRVVEGRSVGTIPASVTAQLKKDAKRRERNVFHQIGTKLRDNVAKINAAAEQKK